MDRPAKRLSTLFSELEDQEVSLQEINGRLGEMIRDVEDTESRKAINERIRQKLKSLNRCGDDQILGLPRALVQSITLLEARSVQRARQNQARAGLPHQSKLRD